MIKISDYIRMLFRPGISGVAFITIVILTFAFIEQAFSQESNFNSTAYRYFSSGLILKNQGQYNEALKQFQEAARLDSNAIIYKAMGDLLVVNMQNYEFGSAAYEKYLEKNPNDNFTISRVLIIYSQTRKYRRAQNFLTKIINAGNNRPDYYMKLIDFYLKDNRAPEAQNSSILFYERTRGSEEACLKIAELFTANSMLLEGEEFFAEYAQKNPGAENIGITVGMLRETLKKPQGAEEAYLSVLRKNNFATVARNRLAILYLRSEDFDRALQLYEGINFDDPSEIPVKIQIANLMLGKPNPQFNRIEEIMLSVKDKVGADSNVFYRLGIAQMNQNRNEEAEISLFAAVKLNPDDYLALYYLANSQFSQDKFTEALNSITKAVKLMPNFKEFYVLKGIIHDRLGDIENAIKTYETGISVKSNNNAAEPTLMNNYSYLLSQNNRDIDKALDLSRKAVLAEPQNSSFLDTIGWVYFKMKNFENAQKYIEKSLEIDPNNPEVLDHLGDVFNEQGIMDKAVQYWQKALDIDTDAERIAQIKDKLKKHNK